MIVKDQIQIEQWPPKTSKGMVFDSDNNSNGIRILHIPSGISVISMTYRHAYKNREEALLKLSAILEKIIEKSK